MPGNRAENGVNPGIIAASVTLTVIVVVLIILVIVGAAVGLEAKKQKLDY